MKTAILWLDQCLPGMRVAETITNRFNAIVINEGVVLDARIIEKLKYFNYHKIRIYIDADDKEAEQRTIPFIQKEYAENVHTMKTVMLDISAGKNLDIGIISSVSDNMFNRQRDIVGILSCLNQVRSSDEYTYSHCLNVAFICLFIAKWLRLDDEALKGVLEAGLLHDVGKCRIPGNILNKPAVLTENEFELMKKHTVYGYKILENTSNVRPSTPLTALEHHEKTNGTGYPMGIPSGKIHLFGKIAAVADIYDAMTSNRVYHKKASPFQVFQLLEDLKYGSLDPNIVIAFLCNLAGYYVGDRVRMSDGREGHVVFINPRAISKPVIQTGDELVNLDDAAHINLSVSEML